jgi:hypothetical protein
MSFSTFFHSGDLGIFFLMGLVGALAAPASRTAGFAATGPASPFCRHESTLIPTKSSVQAKDERLL